MEKRTFVKLCKLQDVTYEGETQEQRERWLANVYNSVGEDGYCIAEENYEHVTKNFSTDEIEFVTVECYNFMGDATMEERFYIADFITVREKATGDIYAYETQEIYEF